MADTFRPRSSHIEAQEIVMIMIGNGTEAMRALRLAAATAGILFCFACTFAGLSDNFGREPPEWLKRLVGYGAIAALVTIPIGILMAIWQ